MVEVSPVRTYETPTRLVHGIGALSTLGQEARALGITRPLLATDQGIVKAGLLDEVLKVLRDAGIDPVVFDRVKANPPIELVDEGARFYASERCDGLIGLGGGSSMDTAKGIGVVAVHGGSILNYEYGRDPIAHRIPPMIAIPTTAGTGSEVTLWAVITDPDRKIKFNVGGTPNIASWVAVIDPALTVNLPPGVTAGTGMDALAHAVECYTMDYHQPFTDAVALGKDTRNKTVNQAADLAVEEVYALTEDVEIPTLESLGFSTDEVPMLAKIAFDDPQTV